MLRGMWDLPGPGIETVSPALAGRLSTTAPPGKSLMAHFNLKLHTVIYQKLDSLFVIRKCRQSLRAPVRRQMILGLNPGSSLYCCVTMGDTPWPFPQDPSLDMVILTVPTS